MTNKPVKVFPCDCCTEGLVVTVEEDEEIGSYECPGCVGTGRIHFKNIPKYKDTMDLPVEYTCTSCNGKGSIETDRAPFINIAFWEYTSKNGEGNQLTKLDRIKYAWHILKGKSPWADMIMFNAKVARNFAHHILYLLSKNKVKSEKDYLVKDEEEYKK